MSDKLTCPVCDSWSSTILAAVMNGDPCPVCGTPADVIDEVNQLREQRGDGKLKARIEELLVDLGRVTAERDRLREKIRDIDDLYGRWQRDAEKAQLDEWRSHD